MVLHSAGLLPFRTDEAGALSVFLVRMAGPYWEGQHEGAWSIAKGLFEPGSEDAEDAARREFAEEVGVVFAGALSELGEVVLRSRKVVHVFAGRAGADLVFVGSNHFEMEWPRGSGQQQSFPEVDDGRWFALDEARRVISAGQRPALDLLEAATTTA